MMRVEETKTIFDCLQVPTLVIKPDAPYFTVAIANKAFIETTGADERQLIGLPFFEAFPMNPDDDGERTAEIQKALDHVIQLQTRYEIKQHQYNLPAAEDGVDRRIWKIDTYPLFDTAGELTYIVMSSTDITSLHLAEEDLKRTREHDDVLRQRNHDLFNFSPIPMWVYDIQSLRILQANEAACRDYGYTISEFLTLTVEALWPIEDRDKMFKQVEDRVKTKLTNRALVRQITRNGRILDTEITSKPILSWGENARIIVALDVTDKLKAERGERLLNNLNELERNVLELHSRSSTPTTEVLSAFLQGIEQLLPQLTCSVMRLKNNRIYNWSSPSLPVSLIKHLEGIKIGRHAGSCGTSAYLKERVIVEDIALDERWDLYKDITIQEGYRACWSFPIIDSSGEVVGTFAVYCRKPAVPDELEQIIIERAVGLLIVILANRKYAEMLVENTQVIAQGQELAQFGNWAWDIVDNVVTWSDSLFNIYGINKNDFKATFEGYQNLLHPEDRDRVYAIIMGMLQTKKDADFEERILRPDGELRYMRSWGTVRCNDAGEPIKMIGACLDITANKKIQEEWFQSECELKKSNELYEYIGKASNDAIYDWELNQDHIKWGDGFHRVFGYSPDDKEFPLAGWTKLVHPEDRDAIAADLTAALNDPTNLVWTAEYRFAQATEGYFYVEETGYIIRDVEGKAIRMIGAIRDITERHEAAKALESSERRFKHLIQEGSDLICIVSMDGTFLYVSPAAERILGIVVGELIGQNGFSFIIAEDRERVIRSFELIVDEKRIVLAPFRVIGNNNELYWIETIITDRSEDEAIGGIIINARDVTERMLVEIENREHLERYNVVAKATSDTIWDCNIMTKEISWNHGIKDVFGHEEYIGGYDWWYDHVHPDDIQKVITIIQNNMEQTDARWNCEYRFRCANGSYKTVFDRGFLLFDDRGNAVRMIGSMQDITERVTYIREMEQHNARLKEIAWAQAHLVREPLTRIMGIVALLSDRTTDADSSETLLGHLTTSAEELDQVVRSIITKSDPEK